MKYQRAPFKVMFEDRPMLLSWEEEAIFQRVGDQSRRDHLRNLRKRMRKAKTKWERKRVRQLIQQHHANEVALKLQGET